MTSLSLLAGRTVDHCDIYCLHPMLDVLSQYSVNNVQQVHRPDGGLRRLNCFFVVSTHQNKACQSIQHNQNRTNILLKYAV